MHVDIYEQDNRVRANVALDDAINPKWDADTHAEALGALLVTGRYMLGGGAAPMLELVRVKLTDREALLAIQAALSGNEWTANTPSDIAEIMIAAGYRIDEFDPAEREDQS